MSKKAPELLTTAVEDNVMRTMAAGLKVAVYTRYRIGLWECRYEVREPRRVSIHYKGRRWMTIKCLDAWKSVKELADHFHASEYHPVRTGKCLADGGRPGWMAPPPPPPPADQLFCECA